MSYMIYTHLFLSLYLARWLLTMIFYSSCTLVTLTTSWALAQWFLTSSVHDLHAPIPEHQNGDFGQVTPTPEHKNEDFWQILYMSYTHPFRWTTVTQSAVTESQTLSWPPRQALTMNCPSVATHSISCKIKQKIPPLSDKLNKYTYIWLHHS